MKVEIFLGVLLAIICTCQSSTLIVDVVEILKTDNYTFVCNLSSSTNLTRWTYLAGSTGTSLMSYQNGYQCAVSGFLNDTNRYAYACNTTSYQATVKYYHFTNRNNNILACKNAHQLNTTGSTWIIKIKANASCSYCQPTISFDVLEVTEGDNVTFVCNVHSNVSYVNWNRNIGENTTAMHVSQNGNCNTTTGKTFLDNTSKYNYTCNQKVYQVTVLNVTRNEHNDMFMCTTPSKLVGNGSNWILNVVQAQVVSVTIASSNYLVKVTEESILELNCTTSTARPTASVFWYRHPNGIDRNETLITDNITTSTDYNDLSVTTSILRLFVTRQYHNTKVFCRANNAANTTKLVSKYQILLNVLFAPRAAGEVNTNITSAKNASKTITVNVIAYPPPTFTWSQLMNGMWTSLDKKDKFVINSSAVQSNLTIRRVGIDDFTKYQVIVKNKVGQTEQHFTLSPYGIPYTPTEFKVIQSLTTTSSIHIEWRPGYNGGPTQTFYIKYKKSSDSAWSYFTVIDSGEETMDITLTSLAVDTQYDIVIFASNIIGNSSESPVLIVLTKATHTNIGPMIGGIAGGVTACLIVVVIIIVIFRRFSLFKECGEKRSRGKSDGTNDSAKEHAYYNTGRLEDITLENNDAPAYDNIESVTNRDNKSAEDATSNNFARVPNYEMFNLNNVESPQYSTLDQTEQCTADDTSNGNNKAVYENMKINVF